DNVGKLLDYLKETGLDQNTVVIYTSDNGFFLGEHGLFDKRFMYEESMRIPFLVRWPGHIPAGSASEAVVANIDFAPTFLALAGEPIPTDMQGRSLLPLLEGKTPADWRTSVYYRYYHDPGHHNTRAHYGLRTATQKLIYYWKKDQWEFYDLASDPYEMHNLYADPAQQEAIAKLVAARLAADTCGVPTVLVARTDAESANLLTADVDSRDTPFIDHSKGRTAEGFFYVKADLEQAIARGLAYAPYADLIWCETGHPDLEDAKKFADAIHAKFPGKMLAYNCSPSFNWKSKLDDATIAKFQRELGAMGYKFQFITLAGFHALNFSMFQLAKGYKAAQMTAYVALQEAEFAAEKDGYTATKHQREVGAGYFDDVTSTVTGGTSSTSAMKGSTEEEQFKAH
ncbi:MAG: DUF4976 domain-containing protein, partial [Proteobacteria bacterium]|nr:DUF4976 domain-containing protein [Pseudomonadota bacterium]